MDLPGEACSAHTSWEPCLPLLLMLLSCGASGVSPTVSYSALHCHIYTQGRLGLSRLTPVLWVSQGSTQCLLCGGIDWLPVRGKGVGLTI